MYKSQTMLRLKKILVPQLDGQRNTILPSQL